MARPFLDLSSGFKTCPRCKVKKALSEFHRSQTNYHGITVYCKQCSYEKHAAYINKSPKHKARAAERAREWREKNPERERDNGRKSRYGMAKGAYAEMLAAQEHKCAICRSPDPGGRGSFHVDHCHSTGRIRGLLCHGCNVSIGHFQNDPNILRAAIDYLNRTKC